MPSKAACQPVRMVTMVVTKYAEQRCSAVAVNIKQQLRLALTPSHYPGKKKPTLKIMWFISIPDKCLELGCWFHVIIFLLQGELKVPAVVVHSLKLNHVIEERINNSFNTGAG